ncbi:hypothetical protein SSX86_016057 [Deinandra increscens subsp. villosa]|uniref:J domain-containing protein n=1 Tax=Deinandra increscens subsp. villosa TaxID=3103831 RepID=A0AAP0CX74_9ASTR
MKTLSRCRSNIEADNVDLIDVDTYDFNNVIVIDIPESLTKKQGGSKGGKGPSRTYIYIDDDETPCKHHADADLDDGRNFENGASSSRRCGPEITSPVKLSKGKRTYSGRGFNAHLESDSSDDEDGPDCEFMEDFSGKVKEQWEKASLKRKAAVQNDRPSSSRLYEDVHSKFGENRNKQKHAEGSEILGTKEGGSFNGDATDVDGCKDDSPLGEIPSTSSEEENEKNDFENAATIDDIHNKFGANKNKQKHAQDSEINGTNLEKEGESFNFDTTDVHGYKDDIPSNGSEEENEKNDFENAPTIDDDNDNEDDVPVEDSIIGQREKLKETDEYKLALEQELLARQKALQIQAEEAQQLRRLQKRKKAECLRLIDMERRQKQRVEEIREIQKKDEENMNLKEQYRTEVIHELKILELTCLDMASLLRGLGIQVGSGPVPLPNEVRAAYKRALLSFHPDRASGSDMREQVEAEEKFKLISRMKEKFSL